MKKAAELQVQACASTALSSARLSTGEISDRIAVTGDGREMDGR